jgi:hypothetical protein
MSFTSNNGSINLGSVGTSTASSTVHIADTTSATGTQLVTIGSAAANTANITTIQGGTANGVGAGGIRLNAPVVALTYSSPRLDVGDTGTVSAQTYRSADQTTGSTNSAAVAYTTGQVVAAAVTAVGCAEQGDCQQKLVDWVHANKVETVVGPLSWDQTGKPQGAHMIQQWIGGKIKIVLPEPVKEADFVYPKPAW